MQTRAPLPPGEEDEESFDAGILRDWLSYVARAARRRWPVVLGLSLLSLVGAALLVRSVPNRYRVEARLLAQSSETIAILTNPSRPMPVDASAATRAVSELVMSRDNLLSLIRQTGLLEHWKATRPVRLRERLSFAGPWSDEILTEELLWELETRLLAWSGNGTVGIAVTWHDPEMAYRIVEVAVQNFLETRHATDMAFLDESIRLLEVQVGAARRGLEDALGAASALPKPARRRVVSSAVAASAAATPVDAGLVRMGADILAKRRALADLVSLRERRIGELQAQLAEQRVVYAESHPVVANIRRGIEALSTESAQVAGLRREIQAVEAQYVARGGSLEELASESLGLAVAPISAPSIIAALEAPTRDASEEYSRSRLAAAIARYYSVADRLQGVQIEREAERAGIKYQYVVLQPPLRPRGVVNRGVKRAIWLAGMAMGPLLGLLVATGMEARRGRIVQRWQVERSLGLAVLAELPTGPRSGEGRRL